MADWSFARFTLAAPKSRQRVRLAVTATSPVGTRNPWNLEDRFGGYTMCHIAGGNVFVAHTSHAIPPYEFQVTATDTGDVSEPRIGMDPRGWLHLVYTRAGSVYRKRSYDEGRTWTGGELAISGGSHPTLAHSIDGTRFEAAYVGGNLVGHLQAPGDAVPGADFTFKDSAAVNLSVENDTFHIQEARESPGRWVLHVTILSESATSDWMSLDAKTWTRL